MRAGQQRPRLRNTVFAIKVVRNRLTVVDAAVFVSFLLRFLAVLFEYIMSSSRFNHLHFLKEEPWGNGSAMIFGLKT